MSTPSTPAPDGYEPTSNVHQLFKAAPNQPVPTQSVKVILVTPAMAYDLLRFNCINRPLNEARITSYAKMILADEWKLNGQTIILSPSGMLDGQHRCAGILIAGTPALSYVIFGVEEAVFDTIDRGKPRSDADLFSIMRVPHAALVAGALKWIDKYFTNRMRSGVMYPGHEMLRLVKEHSDVHCSAKACSSTKKKIAPAILTAGYCLFARADQTKADEFVRQIITGTGVVDKSGPHRLLQRLDENSRAKGKANKTYLFALMVKAWNAFYEDRSVGTLRWIEQGLYPEPFPRIAGLKDRFSPEQPAEASVTRAEASPQVLGQGDKP